MAADDGREEGPSGNVQTTSESGERGERHVGIEDFVVLFHGDLGTGERISQGLIRRSIEKTPWDRYQFVIFVMGLFHLKMACADAIWRVFIKPLTARADPDSIMQHVGILRPRETLTIGKDPGFRRMHQVVLHDGTCRRLDCWLVEVRKHFGYQTLEEYAASSPTLEDLLSIANHLAMTYVAHGSAIEDMRAPDRSWQERDPQYENNLLINMYYLLYEELTYAMNAGDIGRVEMCFEPWILIFKATGKHKYATEMIRHITYVHHYYPEGLK